MNSPRLNLNQRLGATECDSRAGFTGQTAHSAPTDVQAVSPGVSADRTHSAHAESQKPHTAAANTSDRLPTEPAKTSDTRNALTVVFSGAINQLRMISQSPASSLERQSPSAEKNITVHCEDVVGDLVRRWEGTGRIRNQDRAWKIRKELCELALVELRSARYSPRVIDRQTIEGRLRIALDPRPATVVAGIYDVPLSSVYRWRAQSRELRAKLTLKRK